MNQSRRKWKAKPLLSLTAVAVLLTALVGCQVGLPAPKSKGTHGTKVQAVTAVGTGAMTYNAVADTFIRQLNNGPHGDKPSIKVRTDVTGSEGQNRLALLRFQIPSEFAYHSLAASLRLHLLEHVGGTITVWGLRTDGTDCQANNFNEATVTWGDVKGAGADNLNPGHPCVFDGNTTLPGKQPLASFRDIQSSEGQIVSSSETDFFAAYLQHQAAKSTGTTTTVVLLLRRNDANSSNTEFASKEDGVNAAPQLVVKFQDEHEVMATSDTFIRGRGNGFDGPYGSSTGIYVKNAANASSPMYANQGVLRFTINKNAFYKNPNATLRLDVDDHGVDGTYHVWGLLTAGTDCERYDKAFVNPMIYLTFNNVSTHFTNTGVMGDSPCVYKGGEGSLGSFQVTANDVGRTVTFTSQRLNEYITAQANATPNGSTAIMLLLTQEQKQGAPSARFASLEHPTLRPPTLRFSERYEGDQQICGETCTNCPAKAPKSTCELIEGSVDIGDGVMLGKLKITTLGKEIVLLGNWSDDSGGGKKSYSTALIAGIKTGAGNILFSMPAGSDLEVTCKPYLSMKVTTLKEIPVSPGMQTVDISSFVTTPSISLGVRLGQHLREDYPDTPFGDCVPYFFVAVDTEVSVAGFKLNKKLGIKDVAMLWAFDPSDPGQIIEVGGAPVKAATGDMLDGIGFGHSLHGKMKYTSAVKLPKSVLNFDSKQYYSINGHVYARMSGKIPTTPFPVHVDASVFYNLGGVATLTDALRQSMYNGIYKKDLGNLAQQTLEDLNFGFNINSFALDFSIFKAKLGAGSFVRKDRVSRFRATLVTPTGKAPKFLNKDDSTATTIRNFVNSVFNKVNAGASIELSGIVEEYHAIPRFHFGLTAKGKLIGGASASADIKMGVKNYDHDQQQHGLYADLSSEFKLSSVANFVTGTFDVNGKAVFNQSQADVSLTGQGRLTVNAQATDAKHKVEIGNVTATIKRNDQHPQGRVTLDGKLDTPLVDLSLSGYAEPNSFRLEGDLEVNFTPAGNYKFLDPVGTLVNTAVAGYQCTTAYAQCGKKIVTKWVSSIGQCINDLFSSKRCTKEVRINLGPFGSDKVCVEWEYKCEVEDGWKDCFHCKKINTATFTLPPITLEATVKIQDKEILPMNAIVNNVINPVANALSEFKKDTREICYTIPAAALGNAIKSLPGNSALDLFELKDWSFCKKIY